MVCASHSPEPGQGHTYLFPDLVINVLEVMRAAATIYGVRRYNIRRDLYRWDTIAQLKGAIYIYNSFVFADGKRRVRSTLHNNSVYVSYPVQRLSRRSGAMLPHNLLAAPYIDKKRSRKSTFAPYVSK